MTEGRRLGSLPTTHQRPVANARRRWTEEVDDDTPAWPFLHRGRPVVLALAAQQLIYLPDSRSGDFVVPYSTVSAVPHGRSLTLTGRDWQVELDGVVERDSAEFASGLAARQERQGPPEEPWRDPPPATSQVLIVTTNEVPGHEIVAVHGDVFGVIVRARNVFSNVGATLRTIVGGEVAGYTRLLTDSRNEARERLAAEAVQRGANAVVAMRFDCNEIADVMSEVAAYGTAVTISPSSRAADTPNPTRVRGT